jgi:hypothetical protein
MIEAADRLPSGTGREKVPVEDRRDGAGRAVNPMIDKRQPDDRQEK